MNSWVLKLKQFGFAIALLVIPLSGADAQYQPPPIVLPVPRPPSVVLPVPPPLVLPVPTGTAQEIAQRCAHFVASDYNGKRAAYVFAECTGRSIILTSDQQALLDCAVRSTKAESFAACAAPKFGIKLTRDQKIVAGCAMDSQGQAQEMIACFGKNSVIRGIRPEDAQAAICARNANGKTGAFTECAAQYLIGKSPSREQKIAIRCAAESRGDLSQFGLCAGANAFSFDLNPEQQIAVQCVAETGGEPFSAAGCMATRLTARELDKCFSDGIGGPRGCYGDNNDLVGKNGWVRRSLKQLAGGPNSVVNNPNQIWGGDNSFVRNPGQVWGGPNSFVRNPSQIFGGPNSVFNKPGSLKIGGGRCLPWC